MSPRYVCARSSPRPASPICGSRGNFAASRQSPFLEPESSTWPPAGASPSGHGPDETLPMKETGTVDAHVHVYPAEVGKAAAVWGLARGEDGWVACVAPEGRRSIQGWSDPDATIAQMDEAGIEACVMLGWYWVHQETCDLQNRWHAEWIRRHPGRLLGFAAVQPAAGSRA